MSGGRAYYHFDEGGDQQVSVRLKSSGTTILAGTDDEADDFFATRFTPDLAAGEEQAIEACLHWVADNIRYVGTSRGPCEGFTLHPGIETFRDRGDHAGDVPALAPHKAAQRWSAITTGAGILGQFPQRPGQVAIELDGGESARGREQG